MEKVRVEIGTPVYDKKLGVWGLTTGFDGKNLKYLWVDKKGFVCRETAACSYERFYFLNPNADVSSVSMDTMKVYCRNIDE